MTGLNEMSIKEVLENKRKVWIGGVGLLASSVTPEKLQSALVIQTVQLIGNILDWKDYRQIYAIADDVNLTSEIAKYKIKQIEEGKNMEEGNYLSLLLEINEVASD